MSFIGLTLDTAFFSPSFRLRDVFLHPVITPLNNLTYNMSTANLALHGLHPYYQHIIANLPQLLGPAYLLLIFNARRNLLLASALSAIAILSLFQHQEARFLIPTVPLILASVDIPRRIWKPWVASWVIFNVAYGIMMGVYHQGGVVPAQLYLAGLQDATRAVWWKTYSPPTWLLDGRNFQMDTRDLKGLAPELMIDELLSAAPCRRTSTFFKKNDSSTYFVAPDSSAFLQQLTQTDDHSVELTHVWSHRKHIGLDDLDIGGDGLFNTLKRVVGRRGLSVWRVARKC
jgi:phosphatidylinositol glycan class Z